MRFHKFTHTHRQFHGGFIMYIQLIAQLFGQLREAKKTMVGMIDDNSGKIVTKVMLNWLGILMVLKTPYWLFIKPLLCLFHTKTFYEGTYQEWDNGIIDKVDIDKKGVVYFLRVIPVAPVFGKLNKKDLERIFKDKIENVRYA